MTFAAGNRYSDAIGRRWKVVRSASDSEGNLVLIVRNWKKGLCLAFEDVEGTATVLLKDGFTTIYEEAEK